MTKQLFWCAICNLEKEVCMEKVDNKIVGTKYSYNCENENPDDCPLQTDIIEYLNAEAYHNFIKLIDL